MPHQNASSVASLQSLKKNDESLLDGEAQDLESQPKLKLFESPLAHERRHSAGADNPTVEHSVTISGPIGISDRRNSEKPYIGNIYDDRTDDVEEYYEKGKNYGMYDNPEFRHYEEATNIELFYDLFFVANLTTFTDVLEINDSASLQSYAGFFSILWFLWAQVTLFDVRFVTDSIIERIGKAAQFGVMLGLAVVGPNFNPEKQEQRTFRSLAIILMLSRIILGLQYGGVLYQVWYYKNSKAPVAMVMLSNFTAALVYLLTFFGFGANGSSGKVFVVWYITAVIETAVNITISARYKVLSFNGSHLVKRMSLLTLIILGEGVIGLCKSIATIVEIESSWPAQLIGTIVAAVTILYLIYMLYFDWMNRAQFGDLRQEIWASLHFPFHLALVLLVEGASQFIVWRKVVEVVSGINQQFSSALNQFNIAGQTSSVALTGLLANVTNGIYQQYPPTFTQTLKETQSSIDGIGNSTFNSTEQRQEMRVLFATIQDSIFDSFNIEPPEVTAEASDDPIEEWSRHLDAFKLIFVYFFVASGLTLILMNVLNVASKPKMTKGDRIRIFVYFVLGIALASLAAVINTNIGWNFAQSAWVLPSVALIYVFGE
ncbi:hypothetical protein LSUE1_G000472 [Lachnellula suecica]|uniref:Low temperature requirement protein A n=1 Tax=Lachnellula suecica TaxID=602035 RepID=A0A8T9CNP9_9HELO|nr:hypothetical protein LSUE1_G000472 [Lachnellula suecica]